MFYKTLYYWYFSEFIPKKHKTTQDFKDLTAYFAELAVIGALMYSARSRKLKTRWLL